MKLRIMSDLHLEFMNSMYDFDIPSHPGDHDTVLILAGDIHNAKDLPKVYDAFAGQFRAIVTVFGNHEFYRTNMPRIPAKWKEANAQFDNVYMLDKDTVEIDGVYFVGSTLWTDMDNINQMTMWDAKLKMSDYQHIRTGPPNMPWKRKLTPNDTISFHLSEKAYMFEEITRLKEAGETVVAVSHHLPSFQCIAAGWGKGGLNGAYASELFEYVADSKPDLWVHGHTHDSNDFMLTDDTRLVCNPRGYWPDDLNPDFDINFTVEV